MEIRRILNEQLEPLIEWFVPEILNLTEPPNCNCSTIPKIVSCAIQTDVPDKVSCAVQTEVPVSGIEEENFKDDDWSSLGNREIPHGMSCAIQTEIPHGVSRAIQTEIPNGVSCEIQTEIPDSVSRVVQTVDPDSVIENENCEEVDWSSLDNKVVLPGRERCPYWLGPEVEICLCCTTDVVEPDYCSDASSNTVWLRMERNRIIHRTGDRRSLASVGTSSSQVGDRSVQVKELTTVGLITTGLDHINYRTMMELLVG